MNRYTNRRLAVWATALLLALSGAAAPGPVRAAASAQAALAGTVNINTASTEELQLLPGVGASRARAIVAARKRHGGFKSVDQLVEVKGIGQKLLDKLRPHVTLKGRTTALGR